MLIREGVSINDDEIQERFVRSMGPDGRNPRRKATAVELRLDVRRSLLPIEFKERIIALGGRHVTSNGVLVIVSRRYRSQARNRDAAREQLLRLLRQASEPPAADRIATG
jgi:ribosome-associated protein